MKTKILFGFLLGIVLLSSFVSAFGVSAPYWDDNPLTMYKGSTKVVELNLQNMVGNEDVNVQAQITKGNDIASMNTNAFIVKAGTSDFIAPLQITIPSEYASGDKKQIEVEFKTIAGEGEGMVSMGTGMVVGFDVLVTDTPKQPINSGSKLIIVITVAVIAVLAIVLLRRKK